MESIKTAEKVASGTSINLSLAISEDVLPVRIGANEKKEIPNAITLDDLLDKNGVPSVSKAKALLPLELIFIGDKKKLSRITFQSCRTSNGIKLGSFKDRDEKEPVRYPIVKIKTKLNFQKESDNDFGLLLAAFSESSVYGSINTKYPPLFKVVSVEREKVEKSGTAKKFLRAAEIIDSLSENQMLNIGLVIGLPMWRAQDASDRLISLTKLAMEDPDVIIDANANEDNEYILLFHAAKDSRIITEKNGIFRFKNYDLGVDVKGVISYLRMNESVYNLIKSEIGE